MKKNRLIGRPIVKLHNKKSILYSIYCKIEYNKNENEYENKNEYEK